jgi:hypothetical protein
MGPFVALRPALVRALKGDLAAAMVWSLIRFRQQLDDNQSGWRASNELLSTWTGLDARRIRRAVAALRDSGWLLVERSTTTDATNRYTAIDPSDAIDHEDETSSDHEDESSSPPRTNRPHLDEDETSSSSSYRRTEELLVEERPHSGECRRACDELADRIEANTGRRPRVTRAWLTDMDRLHRIDGRTWEEIAGAIHWSQCDDFWRANILSPAALRKSFDRMRLQARRVSQQPVSKVASTMALIERMREAERHDTGTGDGAAAVLRGLRSVDAASG